jgi:hypothetical protein
MVQLSCMHCQVFCMKRAGIFWWHNIEFSCPTASTPRRLDFRTACADPNGL